ncbi:MAG: adenosylmethionine decarboxylase [Candidatus Bathyarchaeota archaeon]|nr:adenosylmethionine decarboxylase [Candidatus Bathyarchaeota archaeon]
MKVIRELLVDLYGCKGNLNDADFLADVLRAAARDMGSTVVRTVTHKFSPTGTTVITILAETHISIHTWPENDYAALDIFVCSEKVEPKLGWQRVEEALKPASSKLHTLTRRIE